MLHRVERNRESMWRTDYEYDYGRTSMTSKPLAIGRPRAQGRSHGHMPAPERECDRIAEKPARAGGADDSPALRCLCMCEVRRVGGGGGGLGGGGGIEARQALTVRCGPWEIVLLCDSFSLVFFPKRSC